MSLEDAPPAGDNPIRTWRQDRLDRRGTAASLAAEYRALDTSEGYVTGLMGPWGSGKTSLVNLVREELAKDPAIPVLDFNPWMFSGADALINSFFREISAQLRDQDARDYGKLADELADYGELLGPFTWLPVVGVWAGRLKSLLSAVKTVRERNQKSAHEQKAKLTEALAELDRPIVVVIDDIDRLSSAEIQDIFKVVRLTANFPNIIYVLVFDRARVEAALETEGMPGRNYLEKIVQSGYDLPVIPDGILWRQVGEALQEVVNQIGGDDRFEAERWPDLMSELVLPHIHTIRDVRRYAASVRPTVAAMQSQMELGDLFVLEAVRVFEPDVFAALAQMIGALTTPASWGGSRHQDEPHKAQITNLLGVAGDRQEVVKDLIRRLFPAAIRHFENNSYGSDWQKTWLRKRLAAHPDILRLYLERVIPSGLSAYNDGERAFALLSDPVAFGGFLEAVEPERLEDVIAALETFEGEYPVDAVPSAVATLLRLKPTIPERPRGFLDVFTADVIVDRVVLRMLRQYQDESAVESAVLEVWEHLGLTSRLELLRLVSKGKSQDDSGLVNQGFVDQRRAELVAEVNARDLVELTSEPRLLGLLYVTGEWGQALRTVSPNEPASVHRAVLAAAKGSVRAQAMGSRHVRTTPTLDWKFLEDLYGSEDGIRTAGEAVRLEFGDAERELTDLVAKYLAGYRHENFGSWDDDDEMDQTSGGGEGA